MQNKFYLKSFTGLCVAGLFFVITAFIVKKPDNTTPEMEIFCKKILEVIQKKDFEGYKKLILTPTEFTDIVMNSTRDEESKVSKIQSFEQKYSTVKMKEEFEEMMSFFAGVSVATLKYDRCEPDMDTDFGVEVATFKFFVSDADNSFELVARECIKSKNGWKMTRKIRIKPGPMKDESCNVFAADFIAMLKKNSLDEYKKFVITDSELSRLVEASAFSEEEKKRLRQKIVEDSPYRDAEKNFNRWKNDFELEEISLADIKNLTYGYEKRNEKGVPVAKMHAYFQVGEKKYQISIRECLKTSSGWKLLESVSITWTNRPAEADSTIIYEEAPPVQVDEIYEEPSPTDAIEVDTAGALTPEEEKELMRQLDSFVNAMKSDSIQRIIEEKKLENEKKKKKKK